MNVSALCWQVGHSTWRGWQCPHSTKSGTAHNALIQPILSVDQQCPSSVKNTEYRTLLVLSRGAFHERFFHHNSNSMEISSCSHLSCSAVIVMEFSTLNDSCDVMACAKLCSDRMHCKKKQFSIEVELRWQNHSLNAPPPTPRPCLWIDFTQICYANMYTYIYAISFHMGIYLSLHHIPLYHIFVICIDDKIIITIGIYVKMFLLFFELWIFL